MGNWGKYWKKMESWKKSGNGQKRKERGQIIEIEKRVKYEKGWKQGNRENRREGGKRWKREEIKKQMLKYWIEGKTGENTKKEGIQGNRLEKRVKRI